MEAMTVRERELLAELDALKQIYAQDMQNAVASLHIGEEENEFMTDKMVEGSKANMARIVQRWKNAEIRFVVANWAVNARQHAKHAADSSRNDLEAALHETQCLSTHHARRGALLCVLLSNSEEEVRSLRGVVGLAQLQNSAIIEKSLRVQDHNHQLQEQLQQLQKEAEALSRSLSRTEQELEEAQCLITLQHWRQQRHTYRTNLTRHKRVLDSSQRRALGQWRGLWAREFRLGVRAGTQSTAAQQRQKALAQWSKWTTRAALHQMRQGCVSEPAGSWDELLEKRCAQNKPEAEWRWNQLRALFRAIDADKAGVADPVMLRGLGDAEAVLQGQHGWSKREHYSVLEQMAPWHTEVDQEVFTTYFGMALPFVPEQFDQLVQGMFDHVCATSPDASQLVPPAPPRTLPPHPAPAHTSSAVRAFNPVSGLPVSSRVARPSQHKLSTLRRLTATISGSPLIDVHSQRPLWARRAHAYQLWHASTVGAVRKREARKLLTTRAVQARRKALRGAALGAWRGVVQRRRCRQEASQVGHSGNRQRALGQLLAGLKRNQSSLTRQGKAAQCAQQQVKERRLALLGSCCGQWVVYVDARKQQEEHREQGRSLYRLRAERVGWVCWRRQHTEASSPHMATAKRCWVLRVGRELLGAWKLQLEHAELVQRAVQHCKASMITSWRACVKRMHRSRLESAAHEQQMAERLQQLTANRWWRCWWQLARATRSRTRCHVVFRQSRKRRARDLGLREWRSWAGAKRAQAQQEHSGAAYFTHQSSQGTLALWHRSAQAELKAQQRLDQLVHAKVFVAPTRAGFSRWRATHLRARRCSRILRVVNTSSERIKSLRTANALRVWKIFVCRCQCRRSSNVCERLQQGHTHSHSVVLFARWQVWRQHRVHLLCIEAVLSRHNRLFRCNRSFVWWKDWIQASLRAQIVELHHNGETARIEEQVAKRVESIKAEREHAMFALTQRLRESEQRCAVVVHRADAQTDELRHQLEEEKGALRTLQQKHEMLQQQSRHWEERREVSEAHHRERYLVDQQSVLAETAGYGNYRSPINQQRALGHMHTRHEDSNQHSQLSIQTSSQVNGHDNSQHQHETRLSSQHNSQQLSQLAESQPHQASNNQHSTESPLKTQIDEMALLRSRILAHVKP